MTPQQIIGYVAVALVAGACGGGSTPGTPPPALTASSPHIGGPGGLIEYCDGPICATNGDAFQAWDGQPLKVLWRVEEAYAGEVLTISGRSADGRDTLDEDKLGRARAPGDDLPGYHYFPSGLKFPAAGIWVLELDTGKVVGTIVVNVTGPGARLR